MVKHGWYGGLLALFGVVLLVVTLGFLYLELLGAAMSGFGPPPEGLSSTTIAVAGGGIAVSIILMSCGVYWQIAARLKSQISNPKFQDARPKT
jgi:hypothetical protein